MSDSSVDASLDAAMACIGSQRYANAESLYRQVLAVQPDHPVALHNLGLLARMFGHLDDAEQLIRRSLAVSPDVPLHLSNLGEVLRQNGKLDEAIAACRRAIELQADCVEAYVNLGLALHGQGRLADAEAVCAAAVRMRPDLPELHQNHAKILLELARPGEAEAACRAALQLRESPEAHNGLGDVLHAMARDDEAIAAYQRALELRPDYADAEGNIGIVLQALGRYQEAAQRYQRVIAIRPDSAEAYSNLAAVMLETGRIEEAIALSSKAISLSPHLAAAHNSRGGALMQHGQVDDAIECFRRTVQLRSGDAHMHSNLLLTMQSSPSADAQSIFQEHLNWAQQHAAPLRSFIRPHDNVRDPSRRLRVGYVSPDFRDHPVAHFIEPVLRGHDREAVETICYAEVAAADAVTDRLRGWAGQWRDIAGMPDAQVAEHVRRDGVDILVDLAGHTGKHRLKVFAMKPAPVQVTWIGYPDTTGLSTIDYLLTDRWLDPPGESEQFRSEQAWRLPESFACYLPRAGAPHVDELPAIQRGQVTFACFARLTKVSADMIRLWSMILHRVVNSRFVFMAKGLNEPAFASRWRQRLADHGMDVGRVELRGTVPFTQYLPFHNQVDLALDTFPFNGHTTTCHALWMGVPTVSLCGDRRCSRLGLSVLSNLGLGELVARSADEYVEIAVRSASDLPGLGELRRGLRGRMTRSAVTDSARFTRDVEAAYRGMWHRFCQQDGGGGA